MTAVADLYRAIVIDHGKRPRNVGRLAQATQAADGDNPLCGDTIHVELALDGDVLVAMRFAGESCLLATASASLMTERLTGATTSEARRLIDDMEAFCARGVRPISTDGDALGDLLAFADVHRHPVRVGCATLAWCTLRRALGD
jgi:nitrogen fixation NifU-like protein